MATRTRFTFTTSLTSGRTIRTALRRVGFSTRLIERKGDQVIVETEAEGREHLLQFEHKMAQAGFMLAGKGFQ
jgi:hypothetical protein